MCIYIEREMIGICVYMCMFIYDYKNLEKDVRIYPGFLTYVTGLGSFLGAGWEEMEFS